MEFEAHQSIEAEPQTSKRPIIFWIGLDLIATLFWSYAIVKLFFFDVDVYFASLVNPELIPLLNYRFLALVGVIALAMLLMRSLLLGFATLYIAFFPFVILLWKFPRFIWKQQSWLFVFAILNSIIGFIRSFRRNFIAGTIFAVSATIILSSRNQYALAASSAVILVLLAFAYILAFAKGFRPSAIFQTYTNVFPFFRNGDFLKMDGSFRNLPVEKLTEKQIEVRISRLQNVVLYNRACLLISKKLRDYQSSGANAASYISSLLTLFVLAVISFALVNYALFRIDSNLFQFTYSAQNFFAFIYYSAGSMFYAANGLVPTAPLSQLTQLAQFLCALLLIVIFVTVIFSVRNERYTAELGRVISSMEHEGKAMEPVLKSEFNLGSIETAIDSLQQAKAGMIGFIIYLTNSLDGQ